MRLIFLLCLLLSACATTRPTQKLNSAAAFFESPSHGFTIPAQGDDGWTMEQLVLEFGRATNQRCLFNEFTLKRLEKLRVPFEREFVVPPEQVYAVVEAALVESDLALTIVREDSPRFVLVHEFPAPRRHGLAKQRPYLIPVDEIGLWAEHPAYLVRTVVTLEHADLRYVSNVLRATFWGGGITQALALGDSRGLLLQGSARWVALHAQIVQLTDQAAGDVRLAASLAQPESVPGN